jgi:hypothetical protein
MTSEGAYVTFLLTAFACILLITFVRQLSEFWRYIVLRFRLFEALLVVVGFLQWWVLSKTDQALHQSAETADKIRTITEATERAWLGPSTARSEPFEVGKPIRVTVTYNNTGRLLASFKFASGGRFYGRKEWADGTASGAVHSRAQDCMSGLPNVGSTNVGLAYPTTGFSSYNLSFNSNHPNLPENERFVKGSSRCPRFINI